MSCWSGRRLPPRPGTVYRWYRFTHLHVRHLHTGSFLADEYVVHVHQDVAVQGQAQSLPRQVGNGVHKHQLVKPVVEVVSKENPLNAVVEPQVLDHGGVEGPGGAGSKVRQCFRGLGAGQKHWFIGRVVGLEYGPVIPW
ncbi:hypothetical protein EYF80_055367 [Liparis tanakae]|uniref:Uncharacterized protein n=1 Tax=Liparis tanakae TaxID=230148 RepID=A0A4Z2F0J4_9TELE|nr:hypothetical protein EYF80_055367 [Liparis tanakae]